MLGVVDDKIILSCEFTIISVLVRQGDSSANSCTQTSLSVRFLKALSVYLLLNVCG